jgi:hypothetical protein
MNRDHWWNDFSREGKPKCLEKKIPIIYLDGWSGIAFAVRWLSCSAVTTTSYGVTIIYTHLLECACVGRLIGMSCEQPNYQHWWNYIYYGKNWYWNEKPNCCSVDIKKHVDYCLESFKNNTNWNLLLIIFSCIKYHSRYAVGSCFYWYVKQCLLKSHVVISSAGGICSRETV